MPWSPANARRGGCARESAVEAIQAIVSNNEAHVALDIRTEEDTQTWLASFVGPKCKVIIVVDRCHGDSAESANACGPIAQAFQQAKPTHSASNAADQNSGVNGVARSSWEARQEAIAVYDSAEQEKTGWKVGP